jgi:ABC-2 type transport system permease protein
MIADILTVALKEIKELPYLRKDKSRTNLFSLLIFLAVFGILLPWQTGREWVTSPFSLLPWVWLPFMMVGTTMVDSFAGERERHTLETLLASRLSDRAILFGKILAGIIYGLVITFLCVLVGLVTVNLIHGGNGLLLSGLGVLVSLRAASVRQAQQTFTITYFVLFIPILVFPMLPSSVTNSLVNFLESANFTSLAIGIGVGVAVLDVVLILAAMARFKRSHLILD